LIRDPKTVEAIVNGTTVTYTTRPIQMQWYVTAQRADGAESLRMPFYYKPIFSQPAVSSVDTQLYPGTVTVGTANSELSQDADYVLIPFDIDAATFKLDATLDFMQVVDGTFSDLDLYLLDPDGNVVTSSTQPGGPEHINTLITRPGRYTYKVDGFLAANTAFTITSSQLKGSALPPTLQTVAGDYVDGQGNHVDFDGTFTISWTPRGGEQGFEIERSNDNENWQTVGSVSGSTNSFALNNLGNGTYYLRVRAITAGEIGKYVTDPSNVISVLVDTRSKVDITSQVTRAISNVSLSGGVFQLDLAVTNNSAQNYVPLVDLNVIGISSTSNTVKVINADNSKDGKSQANAALFGYSQQIGSDEIFSAGEVTSTRTLRFQDNASEMFTFDAVVTAYVQTGGGSSSSSSSSSSQQTSSGSSSSGLLPLTQLKAVLRFTANPLTKTVTAQLVSLK
jgi:hypothetical protein